MRYLIWDFDGTLGYRIGGWSRACVDVLHGSSSWTDIDVDDVRPHLQTGFPWHTPDVPHTDISTADEWWEERYPVFARAFRANGVNASRARELAERVRAVYLRDGWTRYDDTEPTLSRLSAEGWTHLILSNHVPELDRILRDLGLIEYFDGIYTSAEIGYEKPHPGAFRSVLTGLEDAATAWMIGDNVQADVLGAAAVDLPAILVRDTHPDAAYSCRELGMIDGLLPDP